MIPASIEILHDLENHEHSVCNSVSEHHIHKQHLDCADLHKHVLKAVDKIVISTKPYLLTSIEELLIE